MRGIGLVAALALCGCVHIEVERDNHEVEMDCSAEIGAAAAEEAMAADRAFAALAQEIGVAAAFGRYAGADAVVFNNEGEEVHGPAGVMANFADWPEGAKLEWAPATARGAPCGDMAWTWGRSTFTAPDGTAHAGRYITVWKRDEHGDWRFGFDAALRR